jgi:hypothetical protein
MAVNRDTLADLTLEIEGMGVTAERFLRGVEAFFGLVSEVTKRVCVDRPRIEWLVQVRGGSNLVGVRAAPGYPAPQMIEAVLRIVRDGIETLEERSEEPLHFSAPATKHLCNLGRIASTDDKDDTRIRVWVKQQKLDVTHKTVAHVAALLREVSTDYGSVEGRLQVASERHGLHFTVYEPLWDKPVRCDIPEQMLDDALKLFGKRIEVYGSIRYRRDGSPSSIKVEQIIPFPSRNDLPSAAEVRGILKGYTVEYG